MIPTDDLILKTRRGRNQHSLAFQIPPASKNVYQYSFFPQNIRDWNDLPESLISSSELSDDSVSKFTSLVRARDLSSVILVTWPVHLSCASFNRVCTLCIFAFFRTSVSGILSCHLNFRSFLRQLRWKWLSFLACRWYTVQVFNTTLIFNP